MELAKIDSGNVTPPPLVEPEIDPILTKKIVGASTIMYSCPPEEKPDVGDFKDLEVNTKFDDLCRCTSGSKGETILDG